MKLLAPWEEHKQQQQQHVSNGSSSVKSVAVALLACGAPSALFIIQHSFPSPPPPYITALPRAVIAPSLTPAIGPSQQAHPLQLHARLQHVSPSSPQAPTLPTPTHTHTPAGCSVLPCTWVLPQPVLCCHTLPTQPCPSLLPYALTTPLRLLPCFLWCLRHLWQIAAPPSPLHPQIHPPNASTHKPAACSVPPCTPV